MPNAPCADNSYFALLRHYDACLERYGDTALGAGWPNEPDRQSRFAVMLDVIPPGDGERVKLLDFACGTGELFRLVQHRENPGIDYQGVDLSPSAVRHAQAKFPEADFTCLDILQATERQLNNLVADYCVIDGLFTVKQTLNNQQMWNFMAAVVGRLWPVTRKAMAFNVMSKQVDWEREDLFHVSLDRMAAFLHGLAGRAVTFRADYGLFEYTCYLRKASPASLAGRPHSKPAISPSSDASMVCRPLLPAAKRIMPYFEEIDRRRWYTNFGEAASTLAARLGGHFGLENNHCVTASNGTAALTAALLAVAGRARADRPYCVMPSYTFVATAAAALNAGYQPYFVDIDPRSWSIEPERLLGHPMLPQTGAVIVVGPYGRPVGQSGWERFSTVSGIPVVIDAAAGFDAVAANPGQTLGKLPVILSLHATKVFGVGEGGLILCRDRELVRGCGRALNFGFLDSREATIAGFNGKMSEYHAAIGLASLAAWPQTRAGFLATARTYRDAAEQAGLGEAIIAQTGWASNYVLYRAETAAAAALAGKRLSKAGIDFRLWYGAGCHRQRAYAACACDRLPVTEDLSPRVIGLPVAVDLAAEAIKDTVAVLATS
jgi:dTDP-4-amino-4,6-dideoxygalactose transaminase